MDRRKSIKALLVGTVAAGTLVEACNTEEKKTSGASGSATASDSTAAAKALNPSDYNRMKEETGHMKEISAKTFFTAAACRRCGVSRDPAIRRRY